MFKNKLFTKIVLIFTIPILGILFFSSTMVYEKIKLTQEFENNSFRFDYLKSAERLMISLEKEKILSLNYLNSKDLYKNLKEQQDITKEYFDKLKITLNNFPWKLEWKEHIEDLDNNFIKLEELRDRIVNLVVSSEDITNKFNLVNKRIIKTLVLLRFKDSTNSYSQNILRLDDYFNSNANNIEKLSSLAELTVISIQKELSHHEQNINLEKNISYIFLFFCFFTLIPLFFILRNIIFNEQDSALKIEKHKNIYELLNQANKFLTKTFKKDELYIEICELLKDNKDLTFCFIYDCVNKQVIAQDGELKEIIIKNKDSSSENLISKTIKREQNIVINNFKDENVSICYDKAKEFNINSMATFPIKKFNEVVGVLLLYSKEVNFFDQEAEILFDKLVFGIANCLEKIDYEDIRLQQENELKLSSFAFDSFAPMIITDNKNTIVKVNKAFCQIMGYSKEELLGQNPRMFKTAHQDRKFIESLWDDLKINGSWSGDVYNKKANGDIIALRSIITVIKNEEEKITNYLGQYMDISEQKDKEKILEYQATHDNLTGLPNRLLLLDRIEHAITKTVRHKIFGGLIFIDLDNFKAVNDTLGHDMGDVLLITVAKKIKECLRDEDTVSRIGGDEFIVLLDNIGNNSDDARRNISYLAEKIKNTLNNITHINGHKNISTPSIGVTLFSDSSVSVQDIIKQADTAMYSAKKQGKNAIEFF
ncbi:diguanylate cyclase domain-containing protein [Aliarcobacter vitoriensis]|uniref:Diguanylate cyclase n=1 Tax=Aliarcobacter vitoriensis TaxID=2011099 RepID=A0A366MS05_9BACT|nr:diguanylate cyclase [Aliarcobacter vitoriensis]RBQ29025.1 diguanylate cyclase [Aliarcobacter vitoriensis]